MLKKVNPKIRWANQFTALPNQSKFHETVREILCTDKFFKNLSCYQEVPVQELIPEYFSSQHRFDWFIEELDIVLELHGTQHYKPTNFGSMSFEEKQKQFTQGSIRDKLKQEAAEDNNFKYVIIAYSELSKLTGPYLKEVLLQRT